MKEYCYIDILALYENSREARKCYPTAMAWYQAMENKLMPPYKSTGFLIRSREGCSKGLYLMADEYSWTAIVERAGRFDWAQVALRITNNPKLEAITINYLDCAIDTQGHLVAILPQIKRDEVLA